jgi:hypothetical protein
MGYSITLPKARDTDHEVAIHYGEHHTFAFCRTCDWEGERTNEYYTNNTKKYKEAEKHQRDQRPLWARWYGGVAPSVVAALILLATFFVLLTAVVLGYSG